MDEIETALNNGQDPTDEDMRMFINALRRVPPSPDQLSAYDKVAISRGGISQLMAAYTAKQALHLFTEENGGPKVIRE